MHFGLLTISTQNSSKKSLRAEALIGIARMSQRNHSLRTEFASEFIKVSPLALLSSIITYTTTDVHTC